MTLYQCRVLNVRALYAINVDHKFQSEFALLVYVHHGRFVTCWYWHWYSWYTFQFILRLCTFQSARHDALLCSASAPTGWLHTWITFDGETNYWILRSHTIVVQLAIAQKSIKTLFIKLYKTASTIFFWCSPLYS